MNTVYGFDEKELMIKVYTGTPAEIYHTKLADSDVHIISNSSAYAANLIINEKNYELGEKIFEKVISLQDINPESETYGLWPWYMEESLEEMDCPDFNMADFNAKEMIATILEEGDNLNHDIKLKMLESIECACRCIIKRNMGVQYTNVCITDCFVTVAAGEICNIPEFVEYGKNKLKKYVYYTKGHGSISEYNSPTYSILAMNDLGDFFRYIKNEEVLKYADEANDIFWEMIAEHFDYNTLQLNGPHERAYSNFTGIEFLRTIGEATGIDYTKHSKFDIYFTEEQKKKYHKETRRKPVCPQKYIPYFTGEKETKYVRRMVTDGFNYPFFEFSKAASLYKGKGYAVGTMNKSEMWNQRRPILGYIYNDKKDVCFRVRCLHDGFDFSSADFHCVQHKSDVLAAINFSSDRGDTHVDLDKIKDGIIYAEDLRIVFEFIGEQDKLHYKTDNNVFSIDINGTKIRVNPFICCFGEENVETKIESEGEKLTYSIILYSGERKRIDLCKKDRTIVSFTAEFGENREYIEPEYNYEKDLINIKWKPDKDELGLSVVAKTVNFMKNMSESVQLLNGENIFVELFNK